MAGVIDALSLWWKNKRWLHQGHKRHVAASAFGMFPRMAMAALGANLSASFPERINSAAKLILTPGRSGLPDLCLERCVILRINKKFIYHTVILDHAR